MTLSPMEASFILLKHVLYIPDRARMSPGVRGPCAGGGHWSRPRHPSHCWAFKLGQELGARSQAGLVSGATSEPELESGSNKHQEMAASAAGGSIPVPARAPGARILRINIVSWPGLGAVTRPGASLEDRAQEPRTSVTARTEAFLLSPLPQPDSCLAWAAA